MALFFERMRLCAQKVLDTTDIVRDAMLRQLSTAGLVQFRSREQMLVKIQPPT
jgi:hypothetical protein